MIHTTTIFKMDENTALNNTTTTTTTAVNDPAGKRKRGYTPWTVLTVVLLGLAAIYYAGEIRGGSTDSGGSTDKLELNLKCNPSEQNEFGPSGCDNEDCAADNWLDGCKACMCFNAGNPSWCDGTRNEYYDDYYNEHGENPWGDRDRENRKCNTFFGESSDDGSGFKCNKGWQCKDGCCQTHTSAFPQNRCDNFCHNDVKCNPSEQNEIGPFGCKNKDCAADNWLDGCKACMCFNNGNPTWCDGTRNEYYDNYFDQHGENPWGDRKRENRKCNTFFGEEDFKCNRSWQCKRGSTCVQQSCTQR